MFFMVGLKREIRKEHVVCPETVRRVRLIVCKAQIIP